MPCHGCYSMFHTAVGHMEPQDIQQQLESKRMEAKVRMQAFIWVVQPAFSLAMGRNVLRNACHGLWPSLCLSEKLAHFSIELLLLQRSNSRPVIAGRFSTQLSLHPQCTEGAEICTFVLENLGIRVYLRYCETSDISVSQSNTLQLASALLSHSPLASQPVFWLPSPPVSSQNPAYVAAFIRCNFAVLSSPHLERDITQLSNWRIEITVICVTPPQEQKSLGKNRKKYIWKW